MSNPPCAHRIMEQSAFSPRALLSNKMTMFPSFIDNNFDNNALGRKSTKYMLKEVF